MRKNPPGPLALHATTDKAGKFAFDNLKAGTYELSVNNVPQTKSSINTSRSNIKHTLRGAAITIGIATGCHRIVSSGVIQQTSRFGCNCRSIGSHPMRSRAISKSSR